MQSTTKAHGDLVNMLEAVGASLLRAFKGRHGEKRPHHVVTGSEPL